MTTSTPPEGALAEAGPQGIKSLFDSESVKSRFNGILREKGPAFLASVLSVYQTTKSLQTINPQSILSASLIAATLDLPINPNLGQACLVPYKGEASFQIMWKGFVQLALRSGQYKRLHLARVYEGQLVSASEIKGEFVFNEAGKKSNLVMGYYFVFELLNGAKSEFYWSARKCVKHGLRYSQSFQQGGGKWLEDPRLVQPGKKLDLDGDGWDGLLTEGSGTDSMSAKTIVKMSLSKWGPLSTAMQAANLYDQAAFGPDGKPRYIDSTATSVDGPTENEVPMPKPINAAEDAAALEKGQAAAVAKRDAPKPTSATGHISKVAGTTVSVKGKDVGVNKIVLDGQVLPFLTESDKVAELAKKIKGEGVEALIDFEDRDGGLWITMLNRAA